MITGRKVVYRQTKETNTKIIVKPKIRFFRYSILKIIIIVVINYSVFLLFFIQEAMMLMGLENWLHTTAWYMKSLIVWAVPMLILVFFITYKWPTGAVFQYSDPTVLIAILGLYVLASISFCFLISACFKKGKKNNIPK